MVTCQVNSTSTYGLMQYSTPKIQRGELTPPTITQKLPLTNGIPSRSIPPATCEKYRTYGTTTPLQVIHFYYSPLGITPCGYKIRTGGWTTGEKTVRWFDGSERSLFGLHLWEGQTEDVYLCEGETDAMALDANLPSGLKLGYGGEPTPKQLQAWLDTIANITGSDGTLYLCFDSDEKGERYTEQVKAAWRGKLAILVLPQGIKDIAEAIKKEIGYRWDEYEYEIPPNIITGDALLPTPDEAQRKYLTTGYEELDSIIGGYGGGDMIVIAGSPKAGKSTFVADMTVKFLVNHGKVLYIPLELSAKETTMILGAVHVGVPIEELAPERLMESMTALVPNLFMAKHFGHLEIDTLDAMLKAIPHMGIKMLVVDHITAAATSFTEGLTTRLLDAMLSLIQARINEYSIPAIVVTHTNASGGNTDTHSVTSLRGSMSLAQLASVVLGVRRLEQGLTEVYTITPCRHSGKQGRVTFEWTGKFEALSKMTSRL